MGLTEMSQPNKQTSSPGTDITDKEKDENENRKGGLLKQTTSLLSKISTNNPAPKVADAGTGSHNTSPPPVSTSTSVTKASVAASSTATSAASAPVSTSTTKLPSKTKNMEPESVTDLKQTIESGKLRPQFRTFLRGKLDQNKSDNPEHKKMFEQWLDFVLLCNNIFELPETELETRTRLMIQVGEKFLAKPPDGYNLALKSQLNRKELVNHCRSLAEKVPDLAPDVELLKDGYEYILGKLDQKHDIFRKTHVPSTTLAALLCSVL